MILLVSLSPCLLVSLVWASAVTATLLLALALAADPPPPADDLAAAVRQLGAEDYATRARATARLWAAGPAAEAALRAGLRSPDAEVVARCRDLLDRVPFGITPDMPRRFAELTA